MHIESDMSTSHKRIGILAELAPQSTQSNPSTVIKNVISSGFLLSQAVIGDENRKSEEALNNDLKITLETRVFNCKLGDMVQVDQTTSNEELADREGISEAFRMKPSPFGVQVKGERLSDA